jgi:hypothetical protein
MHANERTNVAFPLDRRGKTDPSAKVTVKVARKSGSGHAPACIGEVTDEESTCKVVVLDSGSTYYLEVKNKYKNRRCDATLEIDGEFRGIFRLRPKEKINIRHNGMVKGKIDQHSFKIVSQNRAVKCEGASKTRYDGMVKLTLEPEWDLSKQRDGNVEGAEFRALDGPDAGKVVQVKIADDRRLGKSNHVPDKVVLDSRNLGDGILRAKTVQGDLSKQVLETVTEGMYHCGDESFKILVPIVVRITPKKIASKKRAPESNVVSKNAKKAKKEPNF